MIRIHVPAPVQALIDGGALFAVNNSGGKDSQAMLALLRQVVPASQLVVVHAHLAGEEWDGVEDHVRAMSAGLDVVIADPAKTFVQMVEHRGRFPSPQQRQCTSDLKRTPIDREIRRYLAKHPEFCGRVVSCQGMRAQESSSRSKLATFKPSARNSIAGRAWFDWLPIHELTAAQVFQAIAEAGQQAHWAYRAGMTRLSCMFCIMASQTDLRTAARLNPEAYRERVLLERRVRHTMNMEGRSLEDVTGIRLADGPAARRMSRDPWHGPESLRRGIEQARAALLSAPRPPALDLRAWLQEVDRQRAKMRPATPLYQRFDAHARQLTPAAICASSDAPAVAEVERRVRAARGYTGDLHGLDRVWTRAELGALITAATNRGRQLAAGDRRRAKGPALEPRRIPDDRLDWLIQRHRDMSLVEALRAERARRSAQERDR